MKKVTDQTTIKFLLNQLIQLPYKNQTIFFGPPGTGKSKRIKDMVNSMSIESEYVFRVTFHPEYDFSDFVGSYKPVMEKVNYSEEKITYKFVPGPMIESFIKAKQNPGKAVLLIIEEINRGNCSSIFGDIFQLLDRNEFGESEYEITVGDDLRKYLESQKGMGDCSKIKFPSNLFIYATMNTSDQSLFPLDAAFRRRWNWEYVEIDINDAKKLTIMIKDQKYNWGDFIQSINQKIYYITESEDKQLGNRFVNPIDNIIREDVFLGKVMFYLWNDIFKDEDPESDFNIFKYIDTEGNIKTFTFSDLYKGNMEEILFGFFKYNQIPNIEA
jgi:5-methylcytosine-specific restriction endonuclease McrBC GTP-binding regulatory subunit McrB